MHCKVLIDLQRHHCPSSDIYNSLLDIYILQLRYLSCMFYNREFLGYKVPTYSQSTKYQTNSCTFTSYSSNLYKVCFTPEKEGKYSCIKNYCKCIQLIENFYFTHPSLFKFWTCDKILVSKINLWLLDNTKNLKPSAYNRIRSLYLF